MSNINVTLFSFPFIDYTIQLANSLANKNINVLLVLPNGQINEFMDSIDENIKVYIYSQPRLYSLKDIKLILDCLLLIKNFNTDIVHIQGGHFWSYHLHCHC